jgi:hypothetical protein
MMVGPGGVRTACDFNILVCPTVPKAPAENKRQFLKLSNLFDMWAGPPGLSKTDGEQNLPGHVSARHFDPSDFSFRTSRAKRNPAGFTAGLLEATARPSGRPSGEVEAGRIGL